MRFVSLVAALLVMCAVPASADTATIDVYEGWNMVCAPLVPFDPTPTNVFNPLDVDWTCSLQRWDAPTQSMEAYSIFNPNFGNCLLGDGYFLYVPAGQPASASYAGVPDGIPDAGGNMTDVMLMLPGDQLDANDTGGWHLVGHPYNHDTSFDVIPYTFLGDNILVTDGHELKTIAEAASANWLEEPFQYWNGASQAMETAGYFFATDDHLRGGQGYWIKTKKDNLALIIPAVPS